MTLRRLHVLVSRLPVDSRTQQAMHGEEIATWTPDGAQRHALLYGLEVANWQRSGKKSGRPKPPKPPRIRDRMTITLPDDI